MGARKIIAVCGVVALLVMGGCADSSPSGGSTPANDSPAQTEEPSATLTANPTEIAFNETTTLAWEAAKVRYCELVSDTYNLERDDSITERELDSYIADLTGSYVDTPPVGRTRYHLICLDADSTAISIASARYDDLVIASAEVVMSGSPFAPPTADILANSSAVEYFGSSTLSWTSQNVESCLVRDITFGTVLAREVATDLTGSLRLRRITDDARYDIVCTGLDRTTASDKVTITVTTDPPLYPIAELTADATMTASGTYLLTSGDPITLTWYVVDGYPCWLFAIDRLGYSKTLAEPDESRGSYIDTPSIDIRRYMLSCQMLSFLPGTYIRDEVVILVQSP